MGGRKIIKYLKYYITFIYMLLGVRCNAIADTQFGTNYFNSSISNIFGNSSIIKNFIVNILPGLTVFNPDEYTIIPSIIESYESAVENEDTFFSISDLLKKYGYKVEEHVVKTSDGYFLTMFRIPGNGSVVFVMHGLTSSADDFVTPGPQVGLAYVLADAGYDVWLGNARGTKHSKSHATLSPAFAAFWDYSIDDIAQYDLPAMIEYILNKTNEKQVKIVAHSQGTTICFMLCSERPEFNDKISVIVTLSPVAHASHMELPIFRLLAGAWSPTLLTFAESIGIYSFFSSPETMTALTTLFCGTPELAAVYCYNIFFLVFGADYKQINMTSLPTIVSHVPTGISLKQLKHVLQLIRSGKFRRYDYGINTNVIKYGLQSPPDYILENVTTKVALIHAENDLFCVAKDLQYIKNRLPNVIEIYKVPFSDFSHLDYLFARDAKTLLYDKVLEILDSN